MADIPYLNDTNFNFVTAKNFAIETFGSLPVGYGVAEKGTIINYKGKLHIWDGAAWQTWTDSTLKWSNEINELLSSVRAEDYIWSLTSAFLGYQERNAAYTVGYGDNGARTLGTLHHLGTSATIEWSSNNGRYFSVTARDGSYFNICNDSGEAPPNSNHKPIITNTDTDIVRVTKALFTYRAEGEKWLLLSYETAGAWQQVYNILPTAFFSYSTYDMTFPMLYTYGLPFNGYYEIHAFVIVRELDFDFFSPVNCEGPQELSIKAPSGMWTTIDISPNFVASLTAAGSKLSNNSLQGSAYIEIDAPSCMERKIDLRVVLPNGIQNKIEGGYIHFKYLGKLLGTECVDS